jgi:hypothetical protein
MAVLALYDVYVLLEKETLNRSPGNKIHRKCHQLLNYIINIGNTNQNLANFVVDTTFFSNHVMKEKILAFVLKKEVGPLPARNSSLK